MGVATFITRVLPFVALTKAHDHPLLGRYWKTFAPHDYGGSGVFWLDEPRDRVRYSSRSISAMPDYRDYFALFLQKSVAEYFDWNRGLCGWSSGSWTLVCHYYKTIFARSKITLEAVSLTF